MKCLDLSLAIDFSLPDVDLLTAAEKCASGLVKRDGAKFEHNCRVCVLDRLDLLQSVRIKYKNLPVLGHSDDLLLTRVYVNSNYFDARVRIYLANDPLRVRVNQ